MSQYETDALMSLNQPPTHRPTHWCTRDIRRALFLIRSFGKVTNDTCLPCPDPRQTSSRIGSISLAHVWDSFTLIGCSSLLANIYDRRRYNKWKCLTSDLTSHVYDMFYLSLQATCIHLQYSSPIVIIEPYECLLLRKCFRSWHRLNGNVCR